MHGLSNDSLRLQGDLIGEGSLPTDVLSELTVTLPLRLVALVLVLRTRGRLGAPKSPLLLLSGLRDERSSAADLRRVGALLALPSLVLVMVTAAGLVLSVAVVGLLLLLGGLVLISAMARLARWLLTRTVGLTIDDRGTGPARRWNVAAPVTREPACRIPVECRSKLAFLARGHIRAGRGAEQGKQRGGEPEPGARRGSQGEASER